MLRARHIPGRLNVIADKLSRHRQVIQTECSTTYVQDGTLGWTCLPPDSTTSSRCLCLRFRITQLGGDALSLPWEELDAYAFPPVSLLRHLVSKVVDQGCRRMILIAPGWPNMPWFWDLVNLSIHVPLLLPQVENLQT